jgi:hypothetical protein
MKIADPVSLVVGVTKLVARRFIIFADSVSLKRDNESICVIREHMD